MQPNTICLLTGATGGIGQAIATLLDQQGVTLILHGRDSEKLANLKQRLLKNHHTIAGDLTDAQDRAALMEQAFSMPGLRPNMLINNAGVSEFKALSDTNLTDIEYLLTTNLLATIDFTRLFLQRSLPASTIINVGSAFGAIGYPGYSLYCASKFGLRGFTEALQRELYGSGHRVCYFAPRATNTSINSSTVNEMNATLGNCADSPETVAKALWQLIQSQSARKSVGWPEKFFARLNGLLPEVVDKAITKQTKEILTFAKGEKL
ncbi:SDR family oxidoreductase [Thalassotalea marina]|uniref:Short chain dehydrogenase n=1 Tax=Thalassotalea marina TaxID=1673741 RepID=A0A919BBZ8_9GAMM|nr:SDR family oxidoreductase [Thalassotalea marina]GHF79079.1 short chain dehydrogenase [Thalassotalea marina]